MNPIGRRVLATLALVAVGLLAVVVSRQISSGVSVGCRHVDLVISSSTEKNGVLDGLAKGYNNNTRNIDGQTYCPNVIVQGLTSGTAERALATPGGWGSPEAKKFTGNLRKPDVWTPTSSMWPELAAAEQAEDVPPGGVNQSLTTSAVVLAMPKNKADAFQAALGSTPFDWSMLADLATDDHLHPRKWGDQGTLLSQGDPGWGVFRFGKDSPLDSTSGLSATVLTFDAAHSVATGRKQVPGGDVPLDALTDKVTGDLSHFVRRVETGVRQYIESTAMLRRLAIEDKDAPGWSSVSAVVVQEQLVYLYNTVQLAKLPPPAVDSLGDHKPMPLVPFYAKSGTLMMDHPYVILKHVSGDLEIVAKDFLSYLQREPQQRAFLDKGFRGPDTKTVASSRLRQVLPSSRDIDGQGKLRTPIGPNIQTIQRAWQTLRRKANVILLLDASGSMNHPDPGQPDTRFNLARKAALDAVARSLTAKDRIEVRAFRAKKDNPSADIFQPIYPMSDLDLSRLRAALDSPELQNIITNGHYDTPLYENVLKARADLQNLARQDQQKPPDEQRTNIVIVLTDGKDDYRNTPTAADLVSAFGLAKEPAVPVLFIPFGTEFDQPLLATLGAVADAANHGVVINATANSDISIDVAFSKAFSAA